jgi:hypothetical protein
LPACTPATILLWNPHGVPGPLSPAGRAPPSFELNAVIGRDTGARMSRLPLHWRRSEPAPASASMWTIELGRISSHRVVSVSSGIGCGQGAAGPTREVEQPIEGGARKHFIRAPPPPVAFRLTGQIHPRVIAEIKNILQWSHSEGGRRRPCQLHQGRSNFATVAHRPLQITPQVLFLPIRQFLEPAAGGRIIVRAGIDYTVGHKITG